MINIACKLFCIIVNIFTKPCCFGDGKTILNISLLFYITEHVYDDDCNTHILYYFYLYIPYALCTMHYARNLIVLYTTQDYTDIPGERQAKEQAV